MQIRRLILVSALLVSCGDDFEIEPDIDGKPPGEGTYLDADDSLVTTDQATCNFQRGHYTFALVPSGANDCHLEPRVATVDLSGGFEASLATVCGSYTNFTGFSAQLVEQADTSECRLVVNATCYRDEEISSNLISLLITSATTVQGTIEVSHASGGCKSTVGFTGTLAAPPTVTAEETL